MSTLKVNSIAPAVPGSEDYWLNSAFLSFDGTVPSVNTSGNVSSVTDNAAGNFSINFATNLALATYAFTAGCHGGAATSAYTVYHFTGDTKTSGVLQVACTYANAAANGRLDLAGVHVAAIDG